MDAFVDASLAGVYFLAGILAGGVLRKDAFALREAAPEEPKPTPAEPERDPERSPDWCHTHGKHRDDEE